MPPPTRIISSLACLAFAIAGLCVPAMAKQNMRTVTVFVAASLGDVIAEIGDAYQAETGTQLRIVAAGSSVLARQIEYGAPAEVFISANIAWMDHLETRRRIRADKRRDLLGNQLVLISPKGERPISPLASLESLQHALGDGKLSMALTEAVPAGIYGKTALERLGLWRGISQQVAQTDNVRTALRLVANGVAPLGIVYRSDALSTPSVHIAAVFPANSHPPIRYPAALVASASDTATAFFNHLFGPVATATFKAAGFYPLADPP